MARAVTTGAGALTREEFEAVIDDLDLDIIKHLPDEGSKLGYHPLFKTAKHLTGELNEPLPREAKLKITEVASRLRSLHKFGYLTPVSSRLGSRTAVRGWQRTEQSIALLQKEGR